MNFIESFLMRLYLFLSSFFKMTWIRSKKAASPVVASIIGIFVAILIGAALIESMAYEVTTAVAGNLSTFTSAVSVTNLIPLFFVLLILAAAVSEVMKRL